MLFTTEIPLVNDHPLVKSDIAVSHLLKSVTIFIFEKIYNAKQEDCYESNTRY